MRYDIEFRPSCSLLTVQLDRGESVQAETGAMVAQQGVKLETSARGGLLGGFRRVLGGESFMVNRFTAEDDAGWVMLAPPVPGDVDSHHLSRGDDLFVQSGSYLASTGRVELDVSFQGFRGLFSGEGMFFIRAFSDDTPGILFYHSYGAIRQVPLDPGRDLVVDTGHLVAFTSGVDYRIGRIGGLRSLVGGGEGLVMRLRGSGYAWVQTRNLVSLADHIAPFLPSQKRSG